MIAWVLLPASRVRRARYVHEIKDETNVGLTCCIQAQKSAAPVGILAAAGIAALLI